MSQQLLINALIQGFMGVAAIYGVIKVRKKGIESKKWPTVEGKIVSSRVAREEDSDGVSYGADISYSYNIEGSEYTSRTFHVGDFIIIGSGGLKGSVERKVAKYPMWKTVEVFYNPDDRAQAVLEPGVPTIIEIIAFIMLCLSVVFFFASILSFLNFFNIPS